MSNDSKTKIILDPDLEEIEIEDDLGDEDDEDSPSPDGQGDSAEVLSAREVVTAALADAVAGQSTMDRIFALLSLIFATDHRLPSCDVSISVLPDGEGPDGKGLAFTFEGHEDVLESSDDPRVLDALARIEARALVILRSINPDVFGLRSLLEDHPDGIDLEPFEVPTLSNHLRMTVLRELRDILAQEVGPEAAVVAMDLSGGTAAPDKGREVLDQDTYLDRMNACTRTIEAALATDPRFHGGSVSLTLYGDGSEPSLRIAPKQGYWDAITARAFDLCAEIHGENWSEAYRDSLPTPHPAGTVVMDRNVPPPSNHLQMEARRMLLGGLRDRGVDPAKFGLSPA